MDAKDKLYYLLEKYLEKEYTTDDFCDQFTYVYNLQTDYSLLHEYERELFKDLSNILDRYSPNENERKKFGFYSEEKIVEEVKKTIDQLSALN